MSFVYLLSVCYIFGVNTDDNRYLVKAAALEVKPLLSLTVNGEKQFIMIQLLKQITAHFCEHVQLFSFSNFIDSLSSLTYSFWATLSFCSLVLHCSLVHLLNLVYFNRLSFTRSVICSKTTQLLLISQNLLFFF